MMASEITAGTLNLRSLVFRQGSADMGAGLQAKSGAQVSLTMCKFEQCSASADGGGLWVGDSGTAVTTYGVSYASNSAVSGADIHQTDGSTLTISSLCEVGGTAATQGSALVVGGGASGDFSYACPCTTANDANANCAAITDASIVTAVGLWFSDQAAAIAMYGHIRDW
jgi:hypothetical protein